MIYFDHNATTPIIPEVRDTVENAMERYWANPSSTHTLGRKAADELELARDRLAALLKVASDEIHFTSGGTEADNLALLGIINGEYTGSIVISDIEHPAVGNAAEFLEEKGVLCYRVPVDKEGILRINELHEVVNDSVQLVSVMFANNEIGTIQPMKQIGETAARYHIPLHSDAVQAFGKMPLNLTENGISLCSISSHKIYGPKGCGALYVSREVPIAPRTYGGSQERGIRTGTQNLPAILGFVKAAEIAYAKMNAEREYLFNLTEFLYSRITATITDVVRNGHPEQRIPGTLNISFPGTTSDMIVKALDKQRICVSGGAACHSGSVGSSHVLQAIGRRKQEAVAGVRFSLGRASTREEVEIVVRVLKQVVESLRAQ